MERANQTYAKSIEQLNAAIKKATGNLKDNSKETAKNNKSSKDLDKATNKISNRFSNLGATTEDLIKSSDKFTGTIDDATSHLLKFAGITGIAAAGISAMANTVQTIITNYTGALQAGFTFNDQLKIIRDDMADLGLNVGAMTELMASSGDTIRMLGDNSYDSMVAFINLTKETRALSRDFGFFGLTATETMEELSNQLGVMKRLGFTGPMLASATRDSFMELNREVLAYARLTGKNRRELLRESSVGEDARIRSILDNLQPEIANNLRIAEVGMRAMGESGDMMFEMIRESVAYMESGSAGVISDQQWRLRSLFSGLGDQLDQMAATILDPNTTAQERANVQAKFNEFILGLEDQADFFLQTFPSDSETAQQAALIQNLIENARIIGTDSNAILEAYHKQLSDAERNLLNLNDAIARVQQKFIAQFFKMFGLDNIEEGLTEDQLEYVLYKIEVAGDYVSQFIDFIVDLLKKLDSVNQGILGSLGMDESNLGSRAVMMLGEALLAKTLLNAIGTAAGTAIGTAIVGVLTGTGAGTLVGGITAAFAEGGPVIRSLVLGVGRFFTPLMAAAAAFEVGLSGIFAIFDQELKKEGYTGLQRFSIGLGQGMGDVVDWASNSGNWIINQVLGTDLKTDNDLGGWYRDYMLGKQDFSGNQLDPQTGYRLDESGNVITPQFEDLSLARQQDLRMQTPMGHLDNMREYGLLDQETHAILTGRTFPRMEEYLRRQAELLEETNRQLQRLTRITEDNQ